LWLAVLEYLLLLFLRHAGIEDETGNNGCEE
jgi:hypothetical protein